MIWNNYFKLNLSDIMDDGRECFKHEMINHICALMCESIEVLFNDYI